MLNTLLNHRTIRKYSNKEIDDSTLTDILTAGIRASNTGNMQLYSVVVTRDKVQKEKLAPAHFNQPMVTQAPVVLTFCADVNRTSKWCLQRDAEPGFNNFQTFITAAIDAVLVAQNVTVAAEALGMGVCYLGTTTYTADKIIEILNLPHGVIPITTITLGYPADMPPLTDRLPLEAVIHHEEYKDYTSDDIDRLFAEKESVELYRQFVVDNNKKTLAQVFTDIRYPKESSDKFSTILLDVMKRQGFI